jgi:hypothetical protein
MLNKEEVRENIFSNVKLALWACRIWLDLGSIMEVNRVMRCLRTIDLFGEPVQASPDNSLRSERSSARVRVATHGHNAARVHLPISF